MSHIEMKITWFFTVTGLIASGLMFCLGGCDTKEARPKANSAQQPIAQVSPEVPSNDATKVRFLAEPTEAPELYSRGSYIDRQHAWVAAGFELKRTTDGGRTWQLMRPSAEDEADFGKMGDIYLLPYFITPTRGWLSAIKGTWQTEDGGSTWRQVFTDDANIPYFADEQHGWIARYIEKHQQSYVTKDGGQTWQKCGSSRPLNEHVPNRVFFLTPQVGWAITSRTYEDRRRIDGVAHSSDGGCSWKQLWTSVDDPDRRYCEIYFLNQNEGWLAGCYTTGNLIRTRDGGRTWQPVQTPTEPWRATPIDVFFIDSQRGWIVTRATQSGNSEGMYRTSDGGRTWLQISQQELTSDFAKEGEHNAIPSKWKGGRLYQMLYASNASKTVR